jgi:hypothetical protein
MTLTGRVPLDVFFLGVWGICGIRIEKFFYMEIFSCRTVYLIL